MSNLRRLFIDWTSKKLVASLSDHSVVTLPYFYKYETVPLEVSIVQPGNGPMSAWSKLDVSNISLTVTLNDSLDDATPWAMQDTWTKDTAQNTFSGNLVLNTALANAGLTGNTATVYFEVMMVEDSARVKIYQETCTFAKGVSTTTATSPNPSLEYYTKGEIDGRMITGYNAAGVTITLLSPSGTYARVLGVDDDGAAVDSVIPVT